MRVRLVAASLLLAGCADAEPAVVPEPEPVVAEFSITLSNVAALDALVTSAGAEVDVAFSPGVWGVDGTGLELVELDQPASAGLELLAEAGDPSSFIEEAGARLQNARTFGGDSSSSYSDQPIMPGASVEFGFRATEGDRFGLASMFGQSNDVLVVTAPAWDLFDEQGEPYLGVIPLRYVDAGTEVNQEPGAGPDQAPRQSSTEDGEVEDEVATAFEVEDRSGYQYPALGDIAVLEITAVMIIEPEE